MNKKYLVLIFFVLTFSLPALGQDVGLIINEFSNGSSGEREYIELLLVGCPGRGEYVGNTPDIIGPDPELVDIRGWIIDDNNGDFSGGDADAGEGISPGHIRFADNPTWENVPVGSIIMIYNFEAFKNDGTLPFFDDEQDLINDDNIYVLPINARDSAGNALLEFCPDFPQLGNTSYDGGGAGCLTYTPTDSLSWNFIGLRNDGDGFQTRLPGGAFFHGISYGDLTGEPLISNSIGTRSVHYGGTSGANRVFSMDNIPNDNYRTQDAYRTSTSLPGDETPGAFNSTPNSAYIGKFRDATDAGVNQEVCDLFTFMAARGLDARWDETSMWTFAPQGEWQLETPPDGSGLTNTDITYFFPNEPTSGVAVPIQGIYSFRWTNNLTDEDNCRDSDVVQITFVDNAQANAGPDSIICDSQVNLFADPGPFGGRWVFVPDSTNQPRPVIEDSLNANTLVTVPAVGFYRFRWITGVPGCEAADVVRVGFKFTDVTPEAGPDTTICGLVTDFMGAGQPGSWQIIEVPGGANANDVTITDTLNPLSNVRVVTPGAYRFAWVIGAVGCEQSDTVNITFVRKPTATAGMDSTLCGLTTVLDGNVPEVGSVGFWRQISGPGTTIYSDSTSNASSVTVDMEGQYQYRWRVQGSNPDDLCFATDDVLISFVEEPQPNAGADTVVCGPGVQLMAEAIDQFSMGQWTAAATNPQPVVFSDADSTVTRVSIDTTGAIAYSGIYTFFFTVDRTRFGRTCTVTDSIQVEFLALPGDGLVDFAGNDTSVCGFIAPLNATLPIGLNGAWTFLDAISPAADNVIFSDASAPNSTVEIQSTSLTEGDYFFLWSISEDRGGGTVCSSSDTVRITFVESPEPFAGNDTTACGLNYTLDGDPIDGFSSGLWTQISGPGTAVFSDNAANNSEVSVTTPEVGTYEFLWSVTRVKDGATCEDQDTVTINFVIPPVPTAQPDTSGICGMIINIMANAPTASQRGFWSTLSGPGVATFADSLNPNTSVMVDAVGTYRFSWTLAETIADTLVCPESAVIEVNFIDFPPVNAGADQPDICFASSGGLATLNADPSAGPTGTGQWSVLSVPAGINIGDVSFIGVNNPNGAVDVPTEGEYELIWTIEPGTTCEISDTVFLRFTDFLTAVLNPLPDTVCGLSTLLEATDGFPVGQWTATPSAGVIFDDPTVPMTNVQVPDIGAYEFVWSIGTDICQDTALVRTVFVNPLSNVPADFTVDVFQGKSVQLDVDTGVPGARYTWSPDSTLSASNIPNPIASPFDSENYTVTITTGTDEAACNAVVNVTVNVVLDINPPNVFTPNGDGINDLWEVPLLSSFETAKIQIFNRWGDRVFESTGYNTPWDGTFNGNPVANSTYYYVIELNPEPTVKPLRPEISGSITVTR